MGLDHYRIVVLTFAEYRALGIDVPARDISSLRV
jgi:hypothetical protein